MNPCQAGLGRPPLCPLPRAPAAGPAASLTASDTNPVLTQSECTLSEYKNPIHRRCMWYRNQTTLQLLLHRFFTTARQRKRGGERAIQSLWKCQNRKKTKNHPHTAAGITDLVDFHEFGVGARPFYGHLDDVRGRRHGKPRGSKAGRTGILQCRWPHVSTPDEEWQKERKVARCRCRVNSASSLPVFTGGFRYEKRLWVQNSQGTNCTASGHWGEKTGEGKVPMAWSPGRPKTWLRRETVCPLPRGWAPHGAQGLNELGSLCPEIHGNFSRSAVSGRTDCPGSHGQEAAFL